MGPAGGSAEAQEILYGLHAVREALKAGNRPLQRMLVLRTDKQFTDLVQLARSRRVPIHVQPLTSFDRLVPNGKHQGTGHGYQANWPAAAFPSFPSLPETSNNSTPAQPAATQLPAATWPPQPQNGGAY